MINPLKKKHEPLTPAGVRYDYTALCNASVYGSRYPVPGSYQTPNGVIVNFKNALNCGLQGFIDAVDVYVKVPNMWCFGDPE